MTSKEAENWIAEREERGKVERARHRGPDGRYQAQPASDEALADILARAENTYGCWVRETPSGYWVDLVEMARELLEHRTRERQSTEGDGIRGTKGGGG